MSESTRHLPQRATAVLLGVALALASAAGPVRSAGVEISPLRIVFAPGQASEVLRVRNRSGAPIVLQLRAYAWSQDADGEDRYDPTREVLFFPRIFTLADDEERIVRVAPRAAVADRERSYRLYVEQMPGDEPVQGTAVRTLLRIGIPVFLRPARTEPAGRIDGPEFGVGRVSFRVRNEGNAHFLIQSVDLNGYDRSGKKVLSEHWDGWYLMPGAARPFTGKLSPDQCAAAERVEIEVTTDDLPLRSKSAMSREMCSPS